MPITYYIVDDENTARERLIYLIKHFLKGELEIIGQAGKVQEALHQIPKLLPEISFLDIEMPGMTGLELAQQLQAKGYRGKIIFVTAFSHYSVKAIRANAFDYILKPIDVDELKLAIKRFKSKAERQFNPDFIPLILICFHTYNFSSLR